MRILITNNHLLHRGGGSLYVRDVAFGLLARGHHPIVYSTRLGEVAEELRAATVPVVDDLATVSVAPDLIHGQHHLEMMTAALRFPGAPIVHFCHGWLPWEEMPPRFPRILRYVAVDDTCRDRLVVEHGIPVEKVEVILNFVDLGRFAPRPPLLNRPKRALVFSKRRAHINFKSVRQACARHGIAVDVIGEMQPDVRAHPEAILGAYDLVFAKARAAIESMAVGAAVILLDGVGMGPMVTTEQYEKLRHLNFGIRALRLPVTVDEIDRQIARYDPADAADVSRRIRATAGHEAALNRIVALYEEVVAESMVPDVEAEQMATSAYLRQLTRLLAPRLQMAEGLRPALVNAAQKTALLKEQKVVRAALRGKLERVRLSELHAREQRDQARRGQVRHKRRLKELRNETARLRTENDQLRRSFMSRLFGLCRRLGWGAVKLTVNRQAPPDLAP